MNKRILSMLALPLIAMSGAWANGATEGYLPGKFSVSADKQVYFSKGNLQATTTDLGANWTWAFAEHQWDYVGKAAANTAINGNGTVSTNGTVDLFGWVGASNITWTGGAQYGITNSELFYGSNEGYGTGDYESLKSDWGNCIGQGWYTLSSAEWQYLLNYRNETRANKYGMGTVHGKFGLIILPDDYEAPSGISTTFVPGTTNTTYSDADWSAMESAGAVFLPAAGRRDGSSVYYTDSYGYYWTSSAAGQSYACPLFFYSGGFNPADESIVRYTGCPVRLVCEEISQGATGDASDPEVTWDATNKQGTFTMPEGNVELSVEYYPLATCTAPVAKEGILVGAADEIVTAGTPDGGKMYYLMTLANEKPESTEGFTEALPTAQSVTEEGQVYVWYYVDGDAEHSSSDIYADAVPVTLVAPAPGEAHTLTFAAANIFTIEGGKAVVKVNADARPLNENQELNVKAGSTITIEAIPGYKIKSVKVKPASHASEGVLSGKFSVSADKQVYFSKGNLQATTTDKGANWTWSFAESQWDYVGEAAANTAVNGNGTVSTNGTVDYFGWVGASSNFEGAAQYGISNSMNWNGVNEYGTGENEPLKSDWGNCIGEGWYTLSTAEWQYLLNYDSYANETRANKYGIGTVHSKLGLIILPDGYEAPSGITTTFVPGITNTTYSDEDWSAMEAAGAVFLPAAGYRYGSSMTLVGSYGTYWSSSTDDAGSAYGVSFSSFHLGPARDDGRYCGCSVRLVRDVESE